MMFVRCLFTICLTLLSTTAILAQGKKQYKVNTIAFYNVENLFDTENDPVTFDDDRTPDGKDHWTVDIYKQKLKNMAKVIADIGSDVTKNAPAIIGLAEVENRKVIEDLANEPALLAKDYGIIHFDSPDARGSLFVHIGQGGWPINLLQPARVCRLSAYAWQEIHVVLGVGFAFFFKRRLLKVATFHILN